MKKRTAPSIEDPNLQRIFIEIYDILNELIGDLSDGKNRKNHEGKNGNLNIIQRDKNYILEAKTENGWYEIPLALIPREEREGN